MEDEREELQKMIDAMLAEQQLLNELMTDLENKVAQGDVSVPIPKEVIMEA
jgi:hypothetical protein